MEIVLIIVLFFIGSVVFYNYTEMQNVDIRQSQNLNDLRKTLYDINKRVDTLSNKLDDLQESLEKENEDEQST